MVKVTLKDGKSIVLNQKDAQQVIESIEKTGYFIFKELGGDNHTVTEKDISFS